MSSEGEKDYKQQELKYKKVDAISRILAAVGGIASALAAFLALRGYNKPAAVPQNPIPAVVPGTPTNPATAPTAPATGAVQSPTNNSGTLRSPSTQPAAPASAPTNNNDSDDDDNDDADDD